MSATNRICILAAPRTGSSLLRSLLDSQEDVTFAGEVFHPKNVQLPRPLRRAIPAAEQTREARDADPVGFLERCVEACPTTVFGFKHFQSHADAVRDLVLERPEWRIVLLYRENFLAVYASRLAARASGAWSATGPTPAGEAEEAEAAEAAAAAGPAAPRRPVAFDAAQFHKSHDTYRRYFDKLLGRCAKAGKPFHVIEYAEVMRPEIVQSLARLLGFPSVGRVSSPLRKQGTARVLERFSNPADAMRAIAEIGRPDWAEERGPLFEVAERAARVAERRAGRRAARAAGEAAAAAAPPAGRPGEDPAPAHRAA